MHHCYIGLPQRRIPLCHRLPAMCFFGAICGEPITTLTNRLKGTRRPVAILKFSFYQGSVASFKPTEAARTLP